MEGQHLSDIPGRPPRPVTRDPAPHRKQREAEEQERELEDAARIKLEEPAILKKIKGRKN